MADDQDRQPGSRIIGAEVSIRLTACAAVVYDFEIAMQQAAFAAARAFPQKSSKEGARD
ncbi:MAG TPA: hypothetical protein VIJ04_00880 [Xanthobacteraceae bacterium]